MILVHASPKTLEPYRSENLGVLNSPRRVYGDELDGWQWAADNDAYSKWDPGRFRAMIDRIRGREGCLFVTAPDVVGDWAETQRRFEAWLPHLDGFPVAYVLQDGQPIEHVPFDEIAAVFVGGSTEYKMSADAALIVARARALGKLAHMGRVNSYERVRYARWIGCTSIDGTQFSWFRDRWLPPFLNSLRQETLA